MPPAAAVAVQVAQVFVVMAPYLMALVSHVLPVVVEVQIIISAIASHGHGRDQTAEAVRVRALVILVLVIRALDIDELIRARFSDSGMPLCLGA